MNGVKSDSIKILCVSVFLIKDINGLVELSELLSLEIEKPIYSTFFLFLWRTQSIAGIKSESGLTIMAVSYWLSIAPTIKSVANFTSMPFSLNLSNSIFLMPNFNNFS